MCQRHIAGGRVASFAEQPASLGSLSEIPGSLSEIPGGATSLRGVTPHLRSVLVSCMRARKLRILNL
jgi:hypothetical protein